ncbi:MAG: hypothetical protein WBM17_12915 [Anaerolineales bacterium]
MSNGTGNWGWKKATDPDDVMNFLNGTGAYGNPVKAARICAVSRPAWNEFFAFYQSGTARTKGGWGWKLATDPDDVMKFINGTGPYRAPVKDALICAVSKGSHDEYYVFYRK